MALDFSNIVDKREPREDRQPEPQQAPPEQQDFGGSITIPQSMWDEFDRNLGTPELATNYDKNYVAPVEDFNPYQAEPSQTVVEAQDKYNQINIATQEYADEMTRRIIDDHNGYMTDDNYQGMLNRTYTDQVYDYIRRANKGADDSAWEKPNPQDDLYSKWLPDWIAAAIGSDALSSFDSDRMSTTVHPLKHSGLSWIRQRSNMVTGTFSVGGIKRSIC